MCLNMSESLSDVFYTHGLCLEICLIPEHRTRLPTTAMKNTEHKVSFDSLEIL